MGRQDMGRGVALSSVGASRRGVRMIAKGIITQRANDQRLSAQTIERDYVLAHLCADIGSLGDPRLVFKGGTLLRLCYFDDYRYSADLDFSAIHDLDGTAVHAVLEPSSELALHLAVYRSSAHTAVVHTHGPASTALDRERFRTAIEANPREFIAQPIVPLSTHPTIVGDGIAPRHIDLRPFVLYGQEIDVPPTALTRVALQDGSLVVNSSQGGGSKDTWVLEE